MNDQARWKAVATYPTENGKVDVEWLIEELEELHDLFERGPHWEAIVDIRVTLLDVRVPGLTVEKSEIM